MSSATLRRAISLGRIPAPNDYLAECLRYLCSCEMRLMRGDRSEQTFGCYMCDQRAGLPLAEGGMQRRRAFAKRWAWAVPGDAALRVIASSGPVVEIGAGTGYWASLLWSRGCDVVAYDEKPGRNEWCDHDCYHPVAVGQPEAVSVHADRTLFVCWPPMSGMAVRALDAYGGDRVVYVGEGDGGCTADDAFFARLGDGWDEAACIDVPQWSCTNDYCWIYRRRKETT